ncbi:preprotein translocase subunit SecG [Anaeroglobus geminatus]|uniref:Protein-export membrane protein SecG n=1 Tax=Anaeroglobus geminatus F0357 TaxID=861450 RepID=G9YJP1_9FIRM|nr:preprotein translocase, SecG subunit [Anaeroglobus geminatus F0357]
MITVLEILVIIVSLLLITVVVAQKSKTQGMGAGFGGGAEDLFGSRARGMDALLSKMTDHPFRYFRCLNLTFRQIVAYILTDI